MWVVVLGYELSWRGDSLDGSSAMALTEGELRREDFAKEEIRKHRAEGTDLLGDVADSKVQALTRKLCSKLHRTTRERNSFQLNSPSKKPSFHTSSSPYAPPALSKLLWLTFPAASDTTVTGTRPPAEAAPFKEATMGTVMKGVEGT